MQLEIFPKKKKKKAGGPRKPPDHTASNRLARQIVAYTFLHANAAAYRISYGFHQDAQGRKRETGQTPGLPDVLAIIHGKAVGIEIKIGPDKMRPAQMLRQQEFQQAGAAFWVVNDFKTFKCLFDDLYRLDK